MNIVTPHSAQRDAHALAKEMIVPGPKHFEKFYQNSITEYGKSEQTYDEQYQNRQITYAEYVRLTGILPQNCIFFNLLCGDVDEDGKPLSDDEAAEKRNSLIPKAPREMEGEKKEEKKSGLFGDFFSQIADVFRGAATLIVLGIIVYFIFLFTRK